MLVMCTCSTYITILYLYDHSAAPVSSRLFDPHQADVSDDELPSFDDCPESGSDDGILDEDFEDTRDPPSRSRASTGRVTLVSKAGRSVTFAGAMAQSAYGESSISNSAFHSAVRSKVAPASAQKTITAQARIGRVEICVADTVGLAGSFNCLLLRCGDLAIIARSSGSQASLIRFKVDVSVDSASLLETQGLADNAGRVLLSFRPPEQGSRSVIAAPAFELAFELALAPGRGPDVHISGRSDPVVVSIFAESASRWVPLAKAAMTGLMTEPMPGAAAKVTALFSIPSADFVVHRHPDTPDGAWRDLRDSYGEGAGGPGRAWVAAPRLLLDHLCASEGGIVGSSTALRLCLAGDAGPALEMASLVCSVFLRGLILDSLDSSVDACAFAVCRIFDVAGRSEGIKVCMGSGDGERGYKQYERSFQNACDIAGPNRDSGGMLTPPSVGESSILYFTGGLVSMALGQSDYNMLVAVAKTLSPPLPHAGGSSTDGAGYGAVLRAELALLTMSGDGCEVHMTAAQPVIEMYSSSTHTYFGLIAEDFSLFEAKDELAFLHKTSFQNIVCLKRGSSDLGMSGVFDRAPSISSAAARGKCHVLGVQVLLGEEPGELGPVSRNMRFHMDFQDVTLRYDVASNWLVHLVMLLTPVPPARVQQLRSSRAGVSTSDASCEVSAVSLRIRKCLVDYSCAKEGSRALLSIGRLKVSSTIVSNTPSFSLKFSVEDFALYLSNRLASKPSLEQRPLARGGAQPDGGKALDFDRFVDENGFAQMSTVERFESLAAFRGPDGSALALRVVVDSCFLYLCVDSLNLLSATVARWLLEFKEASGPPLAATPAAEPPIATPTAAPRPGWMDEIITDVRVNGASEAPTLSTAGQRAQGLDAMMVEDFHTLPALPSGRVGDAPGGAEEEGGSACSSQVMEARWLPQYDYLESDFADFEDAAIDTVRVGGSAEEDATLHDPEGVGSDDDSDVERCLFEEDGLDIVDSFDPTTSLLAAGGLRALSKMALGISSRMESISSLLLGAQSGAEDVELESIKAEREGESSSTGNSITGSATYPSPTVELSEALAVHTSFAAVQVATDDCLADLDRNAAWPGLQQPLEEERAGWLVENVASLIQPHYVSLECEVDDELTRERLPDEERALLTDTLITARLSLRIRLFGGLDWPGADSGSSGAAASSGERGGAARSGQAERRVGEMGALTAAEGSSRKKQLFKDNDSAEALSRRRKERERRADSATRGTTRNVDSFLDITAKDCFLRFRAYLPPTVSTGSRLPLQRITVTVGDLAAGFSGLGGRRKKLLGAWVAAGRPRQLRRPMVALHTLGFTAGGAAVEYRVDAALTALRCHFDAEVVKFLKTVAELNALCVSEQPGSSDSALYFQFFAVHPLQMKINYKPSTLDLRRLQQGDYLQLLNIFPLDGLELTLKEQRLGGISGGASALTDKLLEAWVQDIYANQIHKVVSGTAPFRGLSNIGSGLHDLLLIPMGDYRKSGGVLRELRKSGGSLLGTVTREALHASHKLTMLVANALQELVSEGGGRVRAGLAREQPAGLKDGLGRAAEALAREGQAAFETVVAVPVKQYRRDGASGTLRAVIRALPIAVIRPVAGVAEAVSYTLLGLRNELDPSQKLDEEDEMEIV